MTHSSCRNGVNGCTWVYSGLWRAYTGRSKWIVFGWEGGKHRAIKVDCFLEGRSTLRLADILVFGWEGGKHACVDLTGVSPLVELRDHGFVASQVITKAEAGKVAKHEKACIKNQHMFVSFAFDTFGALTPDAVRFLKQVQQVVSSNTAYVKGQNFVFSRVGFAIQKGIATKLVAHLPAISL